MQGFGAEQSPFVRKVRITAIETDQPAIIDWRMVPPPERGEIITPRNPLVKIPVVIMDDGSPLYDSAVICEYLDSLHDGAKLFPESGAARWAALRLQALGDGIGDAAVALRIESLRPQEMQFDAFIERQQSKIGNGLDALEGETGLLSSEPLTIGPISVACAIGYVEFREPGFAWREARPKLAAWYEDIGNRASFAETEPPPG